MVGLAVGGWFAGRAYVRAHFDEWRDGSPIADLAITLLDLGGSGDGEIITGDPVAGDAAPVRWRRRW